MKKLFQIRDRHTRINVVCLAYQDLYETDAELHLILQSGFNARTDLVLMADISGGRRAFYNPFDWNDRTLQTAHKHIQDHWETLRTGTVIDVEYILGETKTPKRME